MEATYPKIRKRLLCWITVLLSILLLLTGINFFLQSIWAHQFTPFYPEGEPIDLYPVITQQKMGPEDYDVVFKQTGLAQAAVDDLRQMGEEGLQFILNAQKTVFTPLEAECMTLIFGRFTCEDLLKNKDGTPAYGPQIAPLRPGDVIVSFSTHTWGWRHGHAGLVVDSAHQASLEAVQLGVNTYVADMNHWRNYSNFMVLRVKDSTEVQRQQVTDFALEHLNDVPYSLLAGVFGAKDQRGAEEIKTQCAYLPWRAWQEAGIDLDGDGGRIVTVQDLVESDDLEVVQVYGIDPGLLMDRQSRN